MANEGGLDRRRVFRFFEQCFQSSGGTGEKEGFYFAGQSPAYLKLTPVKKLVVFFVGSDPKPVKEIVLSDSERPLRARNPG